MTQLIDIVTKEEIDFVDKLVCDFCGKTENKLMTSKFNKTNICKDCVKIALTLIKGYV